MTEEDVLTPDPTNDEEGARTEGEESDGEITGSRKRNEINAAISAAEELSQTLDVDMRVIEEDEEES